MSQAERPGHSSNSSIEDGAAVFTPAFTLDISPSLVAVRVRIAVLSAAFHKDMSLKSILAREALVTVRAGERLHG